MAEKLPETLLAAVAVASHMSKIYLTRNNHVKNKCYYDC